MRIFIMINNLSIKTFLWLLFQSINLQIFAQNDFCVITHNIQHCNINDGLNQWDNRKKILIVQIQFYFPEILSIQESLLYQINYIKKTTKDHKYLGVCHDDGGQKEEYFYSKKHLKSKQIGAFWLSRIIKISSKNWDAALPRICTHAKCSSKKNQFWVFNTHYNHVGKIAIASSVLILTKIAKINEHHPVILMGDFNYLEKESPIKLITKKYLDSHYSTDHFFGGKSALNGFNIKTEENRLVDVILHNERLIPTKTAIISQVIEQHWPSDHFPVISYFS